jgi:glycosyltransferase involved in cell wall biosynthesis
MLWIGIDAQITTTEVRAGLFQPREEGQLVDQLGRTLADPALRQRMSHAGRARAAEFTWRKTAEGYLRVFREANARKRGLTR